MIQQRFQYPRKRAISVGRRVSSHSLTVRDHVIPAPWCKQSKKLRPLVEEVSSYVSSHPSLDVHVGQVNADEETALAYRFFVETDQLPYLYVITSEGRTHYFYGREEKGELLDFLVRGHQHSETMHTYKNPMGSVWKTLFVPLAYLTAEVGHMQAIFYVYLFLLLIVSVNVLLTMFFVGEIIIHYALERMKRRLIAEHQAKQRNKKKFQ